jgi:hypothetical protein
MVSHLVKGLPGSVCCWWRGSLCPALDVWDDDWLSLGLPKAMTVVTDGMALEGGRSLQMYSAVLVHVWRRCFRRSVTCGWVTCLMVAFNVVRRRSIGVR